MLQATACRIDGEALRKRETVLPPIVVGNEEYRFITAEQLREVGKQPTIHILEPVGRNTAPALTLAAIVASGAGEDPVLVAMPADHVVADAVAFQDAVACGAEFAMNGEIVTFGVKPSAPETGYGYIRKGPAIARKTSRAYELARFVEKPDSATAQKYLESNEYFWNSGIFILRASRWLEELSRFRPDILHACRESIVRAKRDNDFLRVDPTVFRACPSESIDYAVMEKLREVPSHVRSAVVVELDAGWSDVGAWNALWQVGTKDHSGNVVKGDVLTMDTRDTLVISESRLVACIGLKDAVVVETPDAVMVTHKDKTQQVKQIVGYLKQQGRREFSTHRKMYRPWGYYDSIDSGERFQVKRIVVSPGASLSLQMHHHRAEHWIVVRGTARVTRGEEVLLLGENQSAYIPLGVKHRLENPGKLPLEIIEVQSGPYLGEDDIVRFEDTYGRREIGEAL